MVRGRLGQGKEGGKKLKGVTNGASFQKRRGGREELQRLESVECMWVNLGRGMRSIFFPRERKQSRTKMGKDKGLGEEGTLGACTEGEGTQLGRGYP